MSHLIIQFAIGLLFMVLGLIIWQKQMVRLIHSYHYKNVSKEDLPAYTKQIGIGIMVIGLGVLINGVFNFVTQTEDGLIILLGVLFIGLVLIFKAQFKYNGGIF